MSMKSALPYVIGTAVVVGGVVSGKIIKSKLQKPSETPKIEIPKIEIPKIEPPKTETPKTETPIKSKKDFKEDLFEDIKSIKIQSINDELDTMPKDIEKLNDLAKEKFEEAKEALEQCEKLKKDTESIMPEKPIAKEDPMPNIESQKSMPIPIIPTIQIVDSNSRKFPEVSFSYTLLSSGATIKEDWVIEDTGSETFDQDYSTNTRMGLRFDWKFGGKKANKGFIAGIELAQSKLDWTDEKGEDFSLRTTAESLNVRFGYRYEVLSYLELSLMAHYSALGRQITEVDSVANNLWNISAEEGGLTDYGANLKIDMIKLKPWHIYAEVGYINMEYGMILKNSSDQSIDYSFDTSGISYSLGFGYEF